MAEGRVTIPFGKWKPDFGPTPGQHLWLAFQVSPSITGYEQFRQITFSDIGNSTETLRGVGVYRGINPRNYIATDTKIYDYVPTTLTDRSRGVPYNTATAGDGFFFAEFGPYVFATNGIDNIQISSPGLAAPVYAFADITPAAAGANPAAKYIIAHKGHVIIANIDLRAGAYGAIAADYHPDLVWWSATDNGVAFGSPADSPALLGTDYKFLYDGDGPITGMVAAADAFFVFKERAVYRVDGPPFQFSKISFGLGTVYPRSIVTRGTNIYFMSSSGPAVIDAVSSQMRLLSTDGGHRHIVDSLLPRKGSSLGLIPQGFGNTSPIQNTNVALDDSLNTPFTVTAFADQAHDRVIFTASSSLTLVENSGKLCWIYDESSDSLSVAGLYSSNGIPTIVGTTGSIMLVPLAAYSKYRAPWQDMGVICIKVVGGAGDIYLGLQGDDNPINSNGLVQFRLPFTPFTDRPGVKTRILAFRPIYSRDAQSVLQAFTHKYAIIYSAAPGFVWDKCSYVYNDSPITSFDGWVQTPNTVYSYMHSLGFNFTMTSEVADTKAWLANIVGVEIIYDALGYKAA